MLKRILPVAVAALFLGAGGALAEPPSSVSPSDQSGIGKHELGLLAEADMAAVKGRGLRSGACTVAVKGTGYLVLVVGTVLRHPIGQGIGLGLVGSAGAICA